MKRLVVALGLLSWPVMAQMPQPSQQQWQDAQAALQFGHTRCAGGDQQACQALQACQQGNPQGCGYIAGAYYASRPGSPQMGTPYGAPYGGPPAPPPHVGPPPGYQPVPNVSGYGPEYQQPPYGQPQYPPQQYQPQFPPPGPPAGFQPPPNPMAQPNMGGFNPPPLPPTR